MKAWKDVRACVWAFFSADVQTILSHSLLFMFKCPVCRFWNYTLEGAKYKAPQSFHTGGQQRTERLRAAIRFHLKKKIRSCKKQIKVHIHFQTLHIRERQFTPFFLVFSALLSFEQIVHAVRGCDTLKTFHFGWRTFTNGGGGWCGGVTRFAPKQSHRVTDDFAEGAQFNTSCWDLFDPSP